MRGCHRRGRIVTNGSTAMNYLARWRMLMAADRLRSGNENVAVISFSLGYESESSFSTGFFGREAKI
ncbi:hypothetical protein [Vreelandella zhaodongensis]|uniref:HTH araC/xylS-type domain-containing protein n=1 Tax=Vreelandella zhaodongensis TaxID=1176240 RepID=A0ABX2SY07_VREZH|nr:hypothetical protein [Halomonas zhaodongensis]NYS46363.1 hypothetical protein [Halomonas zhaodongensis]